MNKQIIAIIVIIGLSLVVSIKKENCPFRSCSTTDVSEDKGQCASASKTPNGSGSTVTIQTCKNGFYCPGAIGISEQIKVSNSTTITANCVADPNKESLFTDAWDVIKGNALKLLGLEAKCDNQAPGEACAENNDCFSNVCTSKKCVGAALDSACTTDVNCNSGLFCNLTTKKCATQLLENATCTRDEECVNSHSCANGKCIKYFTLTQGTESDNEKACVNGTLKLGTKKTCDKISLTTNKCPATDAADSCVYTYDSDKSTAMQTDCQCDQASKDVRCPAAAERTMTYYTDIHTTLRWTGSCKLSAFNNISPCEAEAFYGELYRNNSSLLNVGLVLIAALMMLF